MANKRKDYTFTAHISPDCSPETLQALCQMMEHVAKHVESGGLTMRPGGRGGTPWTCDVCLSNNRASSKVCHSCGTPRR